ncbi:putative bifunctional diguanylate cyclase/phosphodiesterase [Deinococcus maricopensis]|uniref:Diguanylate cyclase/phosphodiesterase n=1 Tax=Deinococcus maricopensis (strain DSM 21211 / LMG 22137 / NRRL B-23946 / LB-34) TaxID=709986 RepID=E8U811_DEIML|nr:bifunctional diguanylate cyclase/phosphodiesterase [Deinococcus maricopensis]ADV67200.1 diguanylate cyclase/phosphodiesterase [Deinococcus maricopensis DSM 21211]
MTTPAPPRRHPDRLLLAALLAVAIAELIFTHLPGRTDTLRSVVGNLAFLPPYLLGATLALRAARRVPTQRHLWAAVATGQLLWTAGQVLYTSQHLNRTAQPFPSIADLFFLLLAPCVLIGLLTQQRRPIPTAQRPLFLLDLIICLAAFAAVSWSVSSAPTTPFELAIAVAYPIADLATLATLFSLIVWRPRDFASPSTLALTLGLLSLLTVDVLYQRQIAWGAYNIGFPLDNLWVLASVCFGLAAALATRQTTLHAWLRAAAVLRLALPYLGLSGAVLLALTSPQLNLMRAHGHMDTPLLIAVLLLLLSGARQLLTQLESRRLHRQLRQREQYDALTGLLSRTHFTHVLHGALRRPLALLLVDLDGFRRVNDTLGHPTGDALLQETARRLRRATPPDATLARLSADEFAVILPHETAATAGRAAHRVLNALNEPYPLDQDTAPVRVTASIGLTLCPDEAVDATSALRNAEFAVQDAKRHGRQQLRAYNPARQADVTAHQRLETHLERAADRGELHLAYQPIVDLGSGRIVAAEALLRWTSADLGRVPPTQFIPVAEERGLIGDLGLWALNAAIRQARAWRDQGHTHLRVNVNVSPLQFGHGDFVQHVQRALDQHGVPPAALALELTEGALIRDVHASNDTLRRLRALGVCIALDDFGTGYSSLSYLQALPVDDVKLDKSFVSAMTQSGPALVEAIVRVAHHLGLSVVAEGVETPTHRDDLRALGTDRAQGFLFARPLDAEDLTARLAVTPALL